jgi:hypothetical protein
LENSFYAKNKLRAAFGVIVRFDVAFHGPHQAARDGETEACAACG